MMPMLAAVENNEMACCWLADGAERARLWAKIVERYPNFTKYQAGVTRALPVVVLRPTP